MTTTLRLLGALAAPLVVGRRPGANSILGSDLAAKAPPHPADEIAKCAQIISTAGVKAEQ
jgi:hypothetical protein